MKKHNTEDYEEYDGNFKNWRNRVYSEDYARDSFTNILYSIEAFKLETGKYPEKITCVSFHFKEERLVHICMYACMYAQQYF